MEWFWLSFFNILDLIIERRGIKSNELFPHPTASLPDLLDFFLFSNTTINVNWSHSG